VKSADTVWLLVSTALVLLTPAFFYGGLVRSKNALNTMMMSVAALGAVGTAWTIAGYSFAFSGDAPGWGNLRFAFLSGVGLEAKGAIPHLLFFAYQATFAIVTAALISGSVVERMRFGPYLAFITLWSLFVYAPVAHWVWGGGWLGKLGALDFAGGTVVHVNAAAAALVACLVRGPRKDFARQAVLPHHVPFTLLGGLLWFGWLASTAGARSRQRLGGARLRHHDLAPIGTLLVWTILDLRARARDGGRSRDGDRGRTRRRHPGGGYVQPIAALALGGVAAFPSYFALLWRARTRLDDSLDVVAAHGGRHGGALLTGVLAEKAWSGAADGALFGNPRQLAVQAVAVAATALSAPEAVSSS
jgi:Amt family ammonium transporter